MVWHRSIKKQTTDDLLKLSIGWLKKHKYVQENTKLNGEIYWKRVTDGVSSNIIACSKYLSNFIGENRYIELSYIYNGENINCKIPIEVGNPNYGGKRYWFVCPRCGRKVAFLYLRKKFLCRHCHNLSYKTQQLGFSDRMLAMSRKYRNKVITNESKKRWLHWTTFDKIMSKSEYYEELSFIILYKKLLKLLT